MTGHGESGSRRVHITITPHGHLDIATLPKLRCGLARQVDQPPAELLVDLTEVTFLGAETLGLLTATEAQLREQGCQMRVRVRGRQARLFRLCGLTHLLEAPETRLQPGHSARRISVPASGE